MPHFHESSSSSSDAAPEFDPQNAYQRIVSDEEYAASSSSEPPLSQQLEPIAVIGMGNIRHLLLTHGGLPLTSSIQDVVSLAMSAPHQTFGS